MTAGDRAGDLEICTDAADGVAAAIAGGADRIELCQALEIGGLTPSAGLVDRALGATRPAGVALFAMVRPRGGDFAYADDALDLAIAEARALIAQGVDGLVFGAVRGGQVDTAACRRWINAVRDAAGSRLPCTFHRAIDLVADPVAAVPLIADLGFDHILTSGGADRASAGAATIRAMVARAQGTSLTIMAGAGVTPDGAADLLAATGVDALHASASVAVGTLDPQLAQLGFATAAMRRTDAGIVRALRSALDKRAQMGHGSAIGIVLGPNLIAASDGSR